MGNERIVREFPLLVVPFVDPPGLTPRKMLITQFSNFQQNSFSVQKTLVFDEILDVAHLLVLGAQVAFKGVLELHFGR